ncbi:hypothetical protein GJ629_07305 [Halapricum sp. CBA1109]|uniref:hypothetical protein n=1 Tax=Halapricum sp. CBA1109 TaxID=2668068 RepID=UPI0012FCFD35|nr:hypothetical protein [Halapricum sp. CBA1109]MUV89727.1 hypothetical protein [Halapricum sp. CBA1109]
MAQSQTHAQPDLTRLLIAAAIVAVLLSLGDILIDVFVRTTMGTGFGVADITDEITDIAGEVTTLFAVVYVVATGATKDGILRAAAIALVGNFVNRALWVLTTDGAGFDTWILFRPFSAAFFVLGVAMAYRLYNRQTILPGVDVRI